MKAFGVALAVSLAVLFTAGEGRADFFGGKALHFACTDGDSDAILEPLCRGYIMGVYDSRVPAPGPGENRTRWKGGWTACVPLDKVYGDILVKVKKWMGRVSRESSIWRQDSASLVAAAVSETWPCP
jgi:hypothetical protein